MTAAIRLHPVEVAGPRPRRLNPFAGRHLGEREFDLLQAYADARLAPLLAAASPGVVDGLETSMTGERLTARFHVNPGTALGADGRPVRLYLPLDGTWDALREDLNRDQGLPLDQPVADGFYFLTVRRAVEIRDESDDVNPCSRLEEDPLRDLRLETVARLGLRLLAESAPLLALPPERAANRLCVRNLGEPVFDADTGAVPVALLRVEGGGPTWLNQAAGRFPALPDGPHRAFLAHTRGILDAFSRRSAPLRLVGRRQPLFVGALAGRRWSLGGPFGPLAAAAEELRPNVELHPLADDDTPRRPLAELLGLEYLPAAGPFPSPLLRTLGGLDRPELAFDPQDLQIDLAPVPASTAPHLVEQELSRGPIDLGGHGGDRLRVLVAVDDPAYRPDLLDLPLPDFELEFDVYRTGAAARSAYGGWAEQWDRLFSGLAEPAYAEEARGIDIPARLPPPPTPADFFAGILARHDARVPSGETAPLRRLYTKYPTESGAPRTPGQPPPGHADPALPGDPGDRLYRKRADLERRIDFLEKEVVDNGTLLADFDALLKLQRQHMDNLTIAFSHLAGGVPGDGTGLQMARWLPHAQFDKPKE